jgi:DNA-binding NarL/FixJ family response regulator
MNRPGVNGRGTKMTKKIKVLVAETHPILRSNLCLLLERETDIEVLGSASDLDGALELVHEKHPDVVIADISIPTRGGMELVQKLKIFADKTSVLAITQYDDEEYIHNLLVAGASGLLMKDSTVACLAGAVRTVVKGGTYLSPNMQTNYKNYIYSAAQSATPQLMRA